MKMIFGTLLSLFMRLIASMALAANLLSYAGAAETTLVVAADGSGQFKTVQEAVMSVPNGRKDAPVIIHIKPGTYRELIYVQREKRFFHLIGDDPKTTTLTYDLHANVLDKLGKPIGTFRTPSTLIDAEDFMAENLTFENSAGPVGQALAIRVDGDRAVFRNCRFFGWQDTILLNRGRQYFDHCYVAGHVDFIFGGATAIFDDCQIHCLRNGYITAASTPDYQRFGFVFRKCKITAGDGVKTYLGRPWRDFAAVSFLSCRMSDAVRPPGWNNWERPDREKTARFAEYNSSGPGARPNDRVKWAKQLTNGESREITMSAVLGGSDNWNPAHGE
jgi:pectinesterase